VAARVGAFVIKRHRHRPRPAAAHPQAAAESACLPWCNCFTSDCQRASVKKKLGSTCSRPTCARQMHPRPARHHHIGRLLHHRARQADGMPRVRHAGHRAGLQIRSVHDGGVQLVLSLGVNTAPRPALNSGSSSNIFSTVSTASSADPPCPAPSRPPRGPLLSDARYAASPLGPSAGRSITPAPPCTTISSDAPQGCCAVGKKQARQQQPPPPTYKSAMRLSWFRSLRFIQPSTNSLIERSTS
jgi:hypothetical protein